MKNKSSQIIDSQFCENLVSSKMIGQLSVDEPGISTSAATSANQQISTSANQHISTSNS